MVLTAVKNKAGDLIGWEAICHNPKHKSASVKYCRKRAHIGKKNGTSEEVIHQLRVWLSMGVTCSDATQHFNLWSSKVAKCHKAGALPTEVCDTTKWPE